MSVENHLNRIVNKANRILKAAGEQPIDIKVFWPGDDPPPPEPGEVCINLHWPDAAELERINKTLASLYNDEGEA